MRQHGTLKNHSAFIFLYLTYEFLYIHIDCSSMIIVLYHARYGMEGHFKSQGWIGKNGLDKMWSNFLTPNSRMVIPAALSIPI